MNVFDVLSAPPEDGSLYHIDKKVESLCDEIERF